MLRVEGFETATVEELDAAIVTWQDKLRKDEPGKALQIVSVDIHLKESDPRLPILCTIVHALVPRHPEAQRLFVPANAGGMQ